MVGGKKKVQAIIFGALNYLVESSPAKQSQLCRN